MKCVPVLGFAFCVVAICAVKAQQPPQPPQPLETHSDKNVNYNATSLADLREQIDKLRRTYKSRSLYSGNPQQDCLESLAPLKNSSDAYELMSMLLGFLRKCQPEVYDATDFGNQLMDTVLTFVRHMIQDNGFSTVDLPGFNQNGFQGWAGYLKNPASVARRSSTQLGMDGTRLALTASLGLDQFHIGYEYEGKVSIFYARGQIRARVNTNALQFTVDVNLSPADCGFTLTGWSLRELGGIDVDINGLGVLGVAKRKIVAQLKQTFESEIRDAFEQLKGTAKQELNKIKCPA